MQETQNSYASPSVMRAERCFSKQGKKSTLYLRERELGKPVGAGRSAKMIHGHYGMQYSHGKQGSAGGGGLALLPWLLQTC